MKNKVIWIIEHEGDDASVQRMFVAMQGKSYNSLYIEHSPPIPLSQHTQMDTNATRDESVHGVSGDSVHDLRDEETSVQAPVNTITKRGGKHDAIRRRGGG